MRARAAARRADAEWSMEPEDVAILLFTSGTTGAPKAAVLRHATSSPTSSARVEFMGARRRGSRAGERAAVPHRRHGGDAELGLRGPPHRAAAGLLRPRRWLALARARARQQRLRGADHARAHRGGARGGRRDGACRTLRALAYGGGKMPLPVIERAMRLFRTHRLHQRLRPHRDQLDDRGARPRRPSRRGGERRSRRAAAARLGGPAAARASRSRSATPTASRSAPGSAARSTCAASRSRASTSGARAASARTAGSRRTTAASSTRAATSSSKAASTT